MEFPELRPESYRWETSVRNPRTVERRGLGTEAWVGIKDENYRGQYDLFLNATLRMQHTWNAKSFTLATLKDALTSSLVELRFEHPGSACTARWEGQEPFLQYTPPESTKRASELASSSVELWSTSETHIEVHKAIGRRRQALGSPSAGHTRSLTIHLIADVEDENTHLDIEKRLDVLLHMNHMYWDGISARMFLGSLLRRLGTKIAGGAESEDFQWGKEVENLPVPILDASKVDIATLGKDFEDARAEFIGGLMAFDKQKSWALDQKMCVGAPSTEFLKFTAAESQSIVHAVRSRLGSGYTISHLGQAATALALLKMNPISDDLNRNPSIVMPLPVNGRRFLKDEYAHTQFGACQAGAMVQFHDAKSFMLDGKNDTAIIAMLERGCQISKEHYDYWLNKPFQMAVNISKDNFLASFISMTPREPSSKAVPIFISDGVNDRYIPHRIPDMANSEPILLVEDVSFYTDSYLPGLLVRMESWKGVTSFGLSYNDGAFAAEQAIELLQHIMYYMRKFASLTVS